MRQRLYVTHNMETSTIQKIFTEKICQPQFRRKIVLYSLQYLPFFFFASCEFKYFKHVFLLLTVHISFLTFLFGCSFLFLPFLKEPFVSVYQGKVYFVTYFASIFFSVSNYLYVRHFLHYKGSLMSIQSMQVFRKCCFRYSSGRSSV